MSGIGPARRRTWRDAEVVAEEGGFVVRLDGTKLRIADGAAVVLPTKALAEAIAGEFRTAGGAEGGTVAPDALPFTRLAGTALAIAADRAPMLRRLLGYGRTDLLCYRAERPEALAVRQHEAWQPWLDWAARETGARLATASGIVAVAQDQAALETLSATLRADSPWALAGMSVIVPALGSLVLGLALRRSALGPREAHALATLDEVWQEEVWGTDSEAETRRAANAEEIESAARFVTLAAP
jgi:chaperone required for assembly of F1-ATPase